MLELVTLCMLESCSIVLILDKSSNMEDDKSEVTLVTVEDMLSIFVDTIDGDNDGDNLVLEMIALKVDRAALSMLDRATLISFVLVEPC